MNEQKNLECDKCNFKASMPSEFLRHLNSKKHIRGGVRVNEIKYKCDKCDYNTNSPYHIKIHNVRVHGTSEEKKARCPYYCEICNVGFFAKLFNDKHFNSKLHKNMVEIKRIQELEKQ